MICKECKQTISFAFVDSVKKQLKEKQLCFSCNFWDNLITEVPDNQRIVIEGHHYIPLPEEDGPTRFKGYGGRTFIIHKENGETITTSNLWHQGKIPEHYRNRLPNNARFH